MYRITEMRAHVRLKSLYPQILEAVSDGYVVYRDSEHTTVHRPTTAANNINDLVFAELVNKLDGVATPVFDRRANMRFLQIGGRLPLLLWVKKLDNRRHSSNLLTKHARRLESGNLELFPSAKLLTLGYLISPDRMSVSKLSITPPCIVGKYPEWWIDIMPAANVARLGVVGQSQAEVVVRRSSQQRKLGL